MSPSKPVAPATLPTDVTEEEAAQGFELRTVPNPRGSMAREVATVPAVVRPRTKGAPGDYAVKVLLPTAKIEYAIKNAHDRVIMDAESSPEAVAIAALNQTEVR